MAEKFYDVAGAARVLGLKHETMRRWLRSGKVRGLRLGRDWRIPERALDELAHKATNQPATNKPATNQPAKSASIRVPESENASGQNASENPLAAALALAEKLRPAILGGASGGTFHAADELQAQREERDKDLSGV